MHAIIRLLFCLFLILYCELLILDCVRDERTNCILFIMFYLNIIYKLSKHHQNSIHATHNCRPTRYEYHRKYQYQNQTNIQNIKWAQDSLFRPGWPKVRTGPACPVEVQSRTCGSFTKRTSPVATHEVLANQSRIPAPTSHRMMLIDLMGLSWNCLKGIKPNRLFHLFLW